jgi:two-component system cell cycle sensor histidine kinase/response regulator CckA
MTPNEPELSHGSDEDRLRATLDSLLEGAQIIDRQWRYAYINPTAARHGGRSVEELVGRTMTEAYPGIDQTEMFAVLRHSMDVGVAAEIESEFRGPDQTIKWFQLMIQPVPEGLFILSLEITGRRRAEAALQETRARFEAVIESLPEGLIIADQEGKILHWNQAALEMLGFSKGAEPVSRASVARLFRLFDLDGVPLSFDQWPMARVLSGDEFKDYELRVTADTLPSQRIFSYSGATVRYGDGHALAFVTIRDITERKAMQEQFERSQRMESIGSLVGGIAHDLNNILMPILLGTTLLRRFNDDHRCAPTIDNIERSAHRAADLVKQVLSFARGTGLSSVAVDVRQVLADVESIAISTFPKNLTWSIDLAGDLDCVRGDRTQLLQVLLNLALNARDALADGGRIRISARNMAVDGELAESKGVTAGPYVVLTVSDTGTGMPPEVVQRVFEPFFTTKSAGKGSGLGLFTVYGIVRQYGGFTEVFSEVGKGTTFRVSLPSDTSPAAAARPESGELPRGNGEVILIVDDEISILASARLLLESFGYSVITADNGAEAIAVYAQRRDTIRLVVTDVMMPLIDGAALIGVLRRMNPEVEVIATSGNSNEDWLVRASTAGASHFLAKPYTAPRILRMVADVLAHQ